MGMIAAAMGWARDTYYENLSSENIQIGIRVLTPLKKSFHRLNFLSIKSTGDLAKKWSSDFRGEEGRIQTPFEIVSAWSIPKGEVTYQVFVTPTKSGAEVFKAIKEQFLNKEPVFNITLGIANFIASIYSIELISSENTIKKTSQEHILMHSAVPTGLIEDLKFEKDEYDSYNFIEEDMMPGDFIANGNREVRKMNRLLFSTTQNPIRVKLNTHYFQIKLSDETINIQFVDT
jgi:CRISPR-associated protein Cas5h